MIGHPAGPIPNRKAGQARGALIPVGPSDGCRFPPEGLVMRGRRWRALAAALLMLAACTSNQRPIAGFEQNIADGIQAVPVLLWKTQEQVEPLLILIHHGGAPAADGRINDFPHIGDINAMPGNLAPVDVNGEIGLSEDMFNLDVSHSPHGAKTTGDFFRFIPQQFQIAAE